MTPGPDGNRTLAPHLLVVAESDAGQVYYQDLREPV